uniref:Secreted protein n=1 Tax=Ascaris lumbricoides TaxID=6252 RepID=A0A0M3HMR1_ASCLU
MRVAPLKSNHLWMAVLLGQYMQRQVNLAAGLAILVVQRAQLVEHDRKSQLAKGVQLVALAIQAEQEPKLPLANREVRPVVLAVQANSKVRSAGQDPKWLSASREVQLVVSLLQAEPKVRPVNLAVGLPLEVGPKVRLEGQHPKALLDSCERVMSLVRVVE